VRYNHANDPVLERIRSAIIDAVAPDKIILFGSRARGEISQYSDYDILVIKAHIENEREITRKINYRLLHERIEDSVDVVAVSQVKWDRFRNTPGFVYKRIDSEGIAVYG
jgi:uncharacterized protein